ncbi:hypothetical protein RD792_007100 [Penstemon davidsonii]|uniref:Transcription factor GTE4 n=1 Tax=Penstemon davidsonii TaxID=160366 RepID=A0ABR0D5H3_9LAMI|nr:hypothetical protein RD792_007100 [Penstemon davidsonii]
MMGGEDERSKETERKVYTRKKSLKEVKNSISSSNLLVNSSFDVGSDNLLGSNRDGLGEKSGLSFRQDTRVRISLSMKSKSEARELRKKLEGERDMIRSLMRKIEANEGQKNGRGFGNVGGEKVAVGVRPPRMSKPLNQLTVSVTENNKSGSDNVEKEKRTPKANKLYRNSEFLLAKDKFPPPESNKKSKSNLKKGGGSESSKFPHQIFKNCNNLLERLMKHKHAWVFNKPVDTVGLGLHDYFEVIKTPMDLGTVKNRLSQNWYKTPLEFAEDVRLTFQNAMTYNPKEQDVYLMAEELSKIFEEKWAPVEADVGPQPKAQLETKKVLDRTKQKPNKIAQSGRVPVLKKPKAKDPNKREMTYDEKQKLSMSLQSLPSEKLENVVQIIKKRDPSLTQQDDEIEVDIDNVDTETLWELDRFVTNYKKSSSKNKRKAEIVTQLTASSEPISQEMIPPTLTVTETPKESKIEEARVASPPVQVEEPGCNDTNQGANQSSSSSDSGSSSSDSDGESFSGDGSDGGHSPKN